MKIDVPVRIRALIALCGLTLLLGLAVVIINFGNGHYEAGYPLVAQFASSSQGLYEGSDVKVRGVNVGEVERIDLDEEGLALITMQIDPGIEIARTTQASIEPLSIFGPKFVNLRLGDDELDGPFYEAGETITVENTRNAPEFTLVLGDAADLLDAVEPRDVSIVISTLAETFAGLGSTFGDTFDHLETIIGIAESNTPEFRRFLADLALVSTTFAEHGPNLLAGARSLHEGLPGLYENGDDLDVLLDRVAELSGTLGTILEANGENLTANLVSLEPVADLLERRRDDVISLVRTLDIFFSTLSDVIRIPNEPLSPLSGALIGQFPTDPCDFLPVLPCLDGSAAEDPRGAVTAAIPATPAAPVSAPAVAALPDRQRAELADLIRLLLPTSDGSLLGSLLGGGS